MGFQIEDGKGTGLTVHVDSERRLHTVADTRHIEMFATDEEFSYVMHGTCNLAVTANKFGICYIKNISGDDLYITRVCMYTENIGINGIYVLFLKNPTPSIVVGEEGTEITIINKNYSSGKIANVDSFIADTTNLEFSNYGTVFNKLWLNEKTNYEIDLKASVELIQNNIFGIRWMATQLGNPTDSTKINICINFVALPKTIS